MSDCKKLCENIDALPHHGLYCSVFYYHNPKKIRQSHSWHGILDTSKLADIAWCRLATNFQKLSLFFIDYTINALFIGTFCCYMRYTELAFSNQE